METILKQAFRLNRYLGYCVFFYLTICFVTLSDWSHHWDKHLLTWASLFLTLSFLVLNEVGIKTLKRFPTTDPTLMEKTGVMVPIVGTLFLSLTYLMTGQLGILLLGFFPVLLSQQLEYKRLVQIQVALIIVLAVVPVVMTYPHLYYPRLLGFAPVKSALGGLEMLKVLSLQLTPFLMMLLHWGHQLSALINVTTDKVMRLQSLAATDALTGLINRRQFNHTLHAEIARSRRHNKPLTLALFDIDDFKKLNDFYGHPVGDRVLRELGQLISKNIRESDYAARYGGEEFALILPETRQIEAYELLERLRALIERTVFCLPDIPITFTISVGVSQLETEQTIFELIEQSDAALYEAKRQGKNRVIYGVVTTPKISLAPQSPQQSNQPPSHLLM